MLRKILFILILLSPAMTQAKGHQDVAKYLLGKWQVEAIKSEGDKAFHPPRHPVKWQFTGKGILIEELGRNGAKINWHYRVVGRDIKVDLGRMAFRWRILGMEDKVMLVRHQLGLLKVKRI